MKKIFCILTSICLSVGMFAQTNTTSINLFPLVEDWAEPFPTTAKAYVENKLMALCSAQGISSTDYLSQFFITVRATPLTKDILPTTPMQIAENMELTFYIADNINQKVFATTSINVKGVGTTEAKAYMDALKHINITSNRLQAFVQAGQEKIIAYYNAEAPTKLKEARALVQMKQYEAAMYIAASIPSACRYFDEATQLGVEIYQLYYAQQCEKKLALARTAWAAEQNAEGAAAAGEYLAQIYSDAPCYSDAMKLYAEIKGKVLDDWKFEMKQYQDGVDIQKEAINAWREVGVAYGKGQQPTTTNIAWLR
ncbi:MAG: hypothetical protein NC038_05830 [Paludibacter sp.]|nr:hypothetical protein [Bacteroidales bacterium]MCM1069269.1 hypothetical protein [Prevotella sp.]MCM1353748.1 hypothetical protein [Bacteroides sp.]MCM1442184.1 hypothetical protein [Muribaculum sp.]MCM1482146.1 hypothetical protein [Paludibacter sp.]